MILTLEPSGKIISGYTKIISEVPDKKGTNYPGRRDLGGNNSKYQIPRLLVKTCSTILHGMRYQNQQICFKGGFRKSAVQLTCRDLPLVSWCAATKPRSSKNIILNQTWNQANTYPLRCWSTVQCSIGRDSVMRTVEKLIHKSPNWSIL